MPERKLGFFVKQTLAKMNGTKHDQFLRISNPNIHDQTTGNKYPVFCNQYQEDICNPRLSAEICLPRLPSPSRSFGKWYWGETSIFFCFTGVAPADGTGVSQKPKSKCIKS
ncbi:MAG: hypothetical protein R6U40_10255 [Desulfobacterales bacterium]